MAYVPGYGADVFLSYSHRDDDQDGWVTHLKETLAGHLTNDLAGEPEVWFDADRVRTGDRVKMDIREKLSNTLMLVAVVTPSYLKSEFCMEEELTWFLDKFGREVLQLVKVPLEPGQGVPLREARYEELFDPQTGLALTGDALDARLNPVLHTVREKLEEARGACRKIYLAQPKTDALRSRWQEIKKALHASGYAVLPNEFVTVRTPDSRIRTWIEEAELFVHVPADQPDPLAARQLDLAREAGKLRVEVPKGQPVEDAPARVRAELSNARRTEELYFVYDYHSDEEAARPIGAFLEERTGRKVAVPQPGETYHRAKLRDSDGIVLFRKDVHEDWYQAQKESLQRAAALRGSRVIPEAWYSVRPGAPGGVQQRQEPPLRWLIERVGAPDVVDLQGFCDALAPRASP